MIGLANEIGATVVIVIGVFFAYGIGPALIVAGVIWLILAELHGLGLDDDEGKS